MQKTVYTCDHCDEVIGSQVHLSLRMGGQDTGVAIPPGTKVEGFGNDISGWRVIGLFRNFVHLHIACAGPFFRNQANSAVGKKSPPAKVPAKTKK